MITDCIIWQGAKSPEGYGRVGNNLYAHRVAYEKAYGPIPPGLHMDHLCRQRDCVNPAHLEAVTCKENIRRGLICNLKTHCKNGHLRNWLIKDSHGTNQCGYCVKIRGKRSAESLKNNPERLKKAKIRRALYMKGRMQIQKYKDRHAELQRAYRQRKKEKSNFSVL